MPNESRRQTLLQRRSWYFDGSRPAGRPQKKTSSRNDSRSILHERQEYNSEVKGDPVFQHNVQFWVYPWRISNVEGS